jgi:hypothetical protein
MVSRRRGHASFLRQRLLARPKQIRCLLGTAFVLVLFYTFSTPPPPTRSERVHDPWTDDSHLPHNHASGDACAAFPKQAFNSVQVILKNGAAEVGSKLPAHFRAVSCVPDFIFSDLEEEVGQYHLYDALAPSPIAPPIPILRFMRRSST